MLRLHLLEGTAYATKEMVHSIIAKKDFHLILRVEETEVEQIWKKHRAINGALQVYFRF